MTDHTQTLERRFSPFSLLSLAFVICQSWLGWSVTFPVALSAGGGPGVFYGYLVSTAACAIVACGLAEQASAFPTSGGQYHAAFMVASPGTRRATSFFTGAFGLVAWALLTVSATIYVAQIIMALASFSHPDFVPARWQTTLVFFAVQAACAAIPCLFARLLPRLETFWFWSSILGAGAGLVVLLATGCGKGGRGDARTVFAEHENRTGWPDGLAFLLGVGQAMYPYLGIDAATHISEEVHRPERVVPRVIGLTILIGFVTAVPFVLAILLSATDLSAVAASLVPLLTAFRQATGSPAASKFYVTWVLVNYFGASMSCMTTTGRLAWSFARDGGLPCSPALSAVHPALGMPVRATAASCVFCMLYGLIYIGSSVAFNGFVASAVLAMHVSYAIPQATALVRGRRETLPPGRPVDLGVFGWFCNAFTVGWVALYAVLFCFPLRLPVEAGSMNYVSVVVVGVAVALCGMWFVGGKRETYIGPAADLVAEMSRASMDQTLSEGIRDDADVHASK